MSIINLRLNDNIVKYTAEHILDMLKDVPFEEIAVVMPSKRPSLFIKRELSRKVKKSFIPPKFLTFDELINEIDKQNGVSKISSIDSAYIIYEIVKNGIGKNAFSRFNFSEFFQWSYEILNFINSLDVEKIDNSKLLNLKVNADIGYDLPANINELLKYLHKIRILFHKKLNETKKSTRGYSYYNADKSVLKFFDKYKKIILFNPYYLNKSETDLFKQIYDAGKLDIILKGNAKNWKALEKIYKDFYVTNIPNIKDKPNDNVDVYAAYDGQSQACLVKNSILDFSEQERKNTVVIVPDNSILQSVMSELYSVCKDINIAVGYPAKKTTVFSLIDSLIQAQRNKSNNKYYVKDIISVISNPLVKNIRFVGNPEVTRIIVHEIVKNFDRFNDDSLFKRYMFITPEEIINNETLCEVISKKVSAYWKPVSPDRVKEIISDIFQLFIINFGSSVTMKNFGNYIKNIADTISEKSLINTYPFNVGALNIIYDIAGQFINCICADEIFASKEILAILEDVMLKGSISLIGSPLKGLQILGLMEARGLSFDNVFILSMTDSVLPSVSEVSPLIPKDISVSLGIGYSGREVDIQKYHFMSLISSAKKVSLIYPNDNDSVRSRFIEEIIWNKQFKAKSLSAMNVQNVFIAGSSENRIKKEYAKTDDIKKYLAEFNYSATNIDTYLRCKLKFYYQFVLRLIEQTDYDDEYENIDIGNCIHEFFKETLCEGLTKEKLNDTIFRELFYKKLDEYLEKYFSNNNTGKNYLLKKLIRYKIDNFYVNELNRPFTKIIGSELVLKSSIDINDKKYNLEARIDRIDEKEDGTAEIIDYKTGIVKAPLSDRKYIEKQTEWTRKIIANNIKSFQLILYKYLYEKNFGKQVDNCYLYSLKTGSLKGLFSQKQDKLKVYNEAIEQMKYIIAEINSDEPFKAESYDDVDCKLCPYFYLCR